MITETVLHDSATDGWIRGIKCLIPNLQVGQTIKVMASKQKGYSSTLYRIDRIETTIGLDADVVIQHIAVTEVKLK